MLSSRSFNFCKACLRVQEQILRKNVCSKARILRTWNEIPTRSLTTGHVETIQGEEGPISKLKNKFSVFISRSRLNATGFILYESIADKISYPLFFREFNLPDTFYSWFVITELHIWMLMARFMVEGEHGRYLRNRIVAILWTDVQQRSRKLGSANPAGLREQIKELSEQFQAALIAYDEGIQADDTVLAAAIWRRVYQYKCDDVSNIENLVKYVRKQMKMLDGLTKEEIFEKRVVNWEPLQLTKIKYPNLNVKE